MRDVLNIESKSIVCSVQITTTLYIYCIVTFMGSVVQEAIPRYPFGPALKELSDEALIRGETLLVDVM